MRQNLENARHSNRVAQEAARVAARGGTTMANVVHTMEAIRAAWQEQEVGISQINQAVSKLDATTQQTAALVEQVAAASASQEEQASTLSRRWRLSS